MKCVRNNVPRINQLKPINYLPVNQNLNCHSFYSISDVDHICMYVCMYINIILVKLPNYYICSNLYFLAHFDSNTLRV